MDARARVARGPRGASPSMPVSSTQLAAILSVLERAERAPTTRARAHEAADAHLADSLVGLDFDELRSASDGGRHRSGARFPGHGAGGRPARCAVQADREPAAQVRVPARSSAHARRSPTPRSICSRVEEWARARAQTTWWSRARWRRSRSCWSTRRRCCAWAARWSTGAAGATRGRARGARRRAQLGLALREIRHVQPFAQARDRHVHVFAKARADAAAFPRRAGMARKRPLGG